MSKPNTLAYFVMLVLRWYSDTTTILVKTLLIMSLLITLIDETLVITDFTYNQFYLQMTLHVTVKTYKLNSWRSRAKFAYK